MCVKQNNMNPLTKIPIKKVHGVMPLGDVEGRKPSPFHGSVNLCPSIQGKDISKAMLSGDCCLVAGSWWVTVGAGYKKPRIITTTSTGGLPKNGWFFFGWNIGSSPVSRNLLVHIFRCWLLVLSKSVSDGSLPVIRVYLLEKRGILCITRA